MNFAVQEKKQYFVSWGRKIIEVFENPIKYLRKPYYLNIKFHPDFYITEVSTNHPELQKFKIENIFPKTLYRIIDFNKHPSLLNLLYRLKLQAPKKPHNIHLQLNSSKVLTRGKLKILPSKKKYSLKLKVQSIDSTQYILDAYQNIPNHIKEVGYGLYDEINKISFTEPIEISEVLKKFDYSQASLYRIFKDVIGIYPSTVWTNRRLIGFKQHLLDSKETISEIYWQYGFTNQRSLNRNFKKTFEIAPLEFRQKHKRT